MGFVLRFLAAFCLALAVVAAVIDAARSVAASALVATSLGQACGAIGFDLGGWMSGIAPGGAFADIWAAITLAALSAPAILVFAGLALIFYAMGYRRRRDTRRALHA